MLNKRRMIAAGAAMVCTLAINVQAMAQKYDSLQQPTQNFYAPQGQQPQQKYVAPENGQGISQSDMKRAKALSAAAAALADSELDKAMGIERPEIAIALEEDEEEDPEDPLPSGPLKPFA